MDRVAKALFLILLVVTGYAAFRANVENIRFSDYVVYGKSAGGDAPIVISDEHKSMEMADTCRTDIFGPGLRLRLLRLGLADRVKDNESWSNAAAAADTYLTASIRCAPFRADSWVRSAMVAQTIAEDPARLALLMTQASSLNPFEGGQVVARMALWSRISAETQSLSSSLIASDVDVILKYGDRAMLAALFKSRSAYVRELALKGLDRLPNDRKIIVRPMTPD